MPLWPTTLPAPSINSLNESLANNVIRSSTDKGPAKVRRRSTANVAPLGFTLKLRAAQLDVLIAFHDDDLYSGALSFDYTHPRSGAAVTARFTQPPQWSDQDAIVFNVAIALEVLP